MLCRTLPAPGTRAVSPGNCELRGSLIGRRSDAVPLTSRRSSDDPNIGIIVLHRAYAAVVLYTRYADAWVELGRARARRHGLGSSREARLKAVTIDPKLVAPYVEPGLASGLSATGRIQSIT